MISRYQREGMSLFWSEENKYRSWLEVELAICEALFQEGIITHKELSSIQKKADFTVGEILEEEKKSKHDVASFVTVVSKRLGEEGRFFHYGVTSSDVLDTSLSLRLRDAGKNILKEVENFLKVLKDKAFQYKNTLMIGRSHGIHAEPTTFGLKCALWYEEMKRNKKRLERAIHNISVGKISGAVGTYAHLSSRIEKHVCKKLGLVEDPITTQVIQRDRHAEYFSTLAILAGTIEKIAVEVRHLQRTEVGEVEENFSRGQKGSSSMPHKKNPILSENLTGLARLVRSYASASLENMALWHERDISHSSVERVIAEDATTLVDFMLVRISSVVKNLVVKEEKMLENLNQTKGLIYSQKLLLKLIEKGAVREKAYTLIQRNALSAYENGKNFKELVLKDKDIHKILKTKEIEDSFNPKLYVQEVDQTFKRVFNS
ncbi:MAG: adenylosuccinate lyase [Deltaproteobacteria bacterium]|nr:adenylosuccinate lyase [Deltaproteobacteria bacterium]